MALSNVPRGPAASERWDKEKPVPISYYIYPSIFSRYEIKTSAAQPCCLAFTGPSNLQSRLEITKTTTAMLSTKEAVVGVVTINCYELECVLGSALGPNLLILTCNRRPEKVARRGPTHTFMISIADDCNILRQRYRSRGGLSLSFAPSGLL